jgi:predicted nucleotidyltransferase
MIIIKKTREVGKSSGVILPRKWLNRNVMVQLITNSLETISKEVLDILLKKNILNEVIGIYLAGSYARGEENPYSDVDILVVTSKTNKILKEDNYEITCINEENLEEALKKDLYIVSLLQEARPLLNEKSLRYYKSMMNPRTFKLSILNEIRRILKLNEIIMKDESTVNNGVIYSLILRLRELYLLDCIFKRKIPSKKEFLELVDNDKLYKMYEDIKNDINKEERANTNEAMEILNKTKVILKRWERIKT